MEEPVNPEPIEAPTEDETAEAPPAGPADEASAGEQPKPLAAVLGDTVLLAVSTSQAWVTGVSDVTGSGVGAQRTLTFDSGITAIEQTTSTSGSCVMFGSGGALAGETNIAVFTEPDIPAAARGANSNCAGPPAGGGSRTSTVSLSKPVLAPVIHVQNLDASRLGVTGSGITLTQLAKNNALEVSGTTLNTTLQQALETGCAGNDGTNPNGGCGSFRLAAASPISMFTLSNNTANSPLTGSAYNDSWSYTLSYPTAPLTKVFSPARITTGGTSQLTFSIANPAQPTQPTLSPMGFTDSLPAGVTLANSTVSNNGSCGTPTVMTAAGSDEVVVSGVSVAAGTTCEITVNVTSDTVGSYVNDTDNLSTTVANLVPNAETTLEVFEPDVDFGDAPASFGTLLAADGPRHIIVPGLHLGASVDAENDGQPSAAADGDGADEDAFTDTLVLNPGATSPSLTVPVTNTTGGDATLHSWIDANGNGTFEPAEYTASPVPDGATTAALDFSGLTPLQDGTNPAVRLRLTTDALTDDPTTPVDERALGAASDGEVEDHAAAVATVLQASCTAPFIENFGAGAGFGPELPAGYTTYQYVGAPEDDGMIDAAEYALVPSPQDAHSSWLAGEDRTPGDTDGRMMVVNADESPGIFFQRTFTGLAPGAMYDFSAWISNVINVDLPVQPNVTFRVVDPATGDVLAEISTGDIPRTTSLEWERFALQFTATQETVRLELVNNAPGSVGNDLAIDDISFSPVCEFGDAPDSYGTLVASDGAGHIAAGPTLGNERDTEPDGQPTGAADGDDTTGTADEDGVATPIEVTVGAETTVTVSTTNDSDEDVTLAGWIDLDGNGIFEASERALVMAAAGSGAEDHELTFPVGTVSTDTYARFRIYGEVVSDPSPTGTAGAGEVEDYVVTVLEPGLSIEKTSDATAATRAGDEVTYTVTATNTGSGDYTETNPAPVLDDLSGVLDDATFDGTATAEIDGVSVDPPAFADPMLRWTGPLAAGESVVIVYTVTLTGDGDGVVENVAFQPDCDVTDPACDPVPPLACENGVDPQTGLPCDTVILELPRLAVDKSADTSELPTDGGVVTYTVLLTNVGPGDYTADASATSTDDLSDVLDDADYNGDAVAVIDGAPAGTLEAADGAITWTGPLAAGETVVITYSVTYDAEAVDGDNRLVNVVCVAEDQLAPGALPCDTVEIPGADLDVAKTVNPTSGTTVAAGDQLTYTLTFDNDGPASADVAWTDHLAGILDDAHVTAGPTPGPGLTVTSITDGSFTIGGSVPGGQVRTVTYTVTVGADGERGDNVLGNFLVPEGIEPPEQCAVGSELCTENPVSEIVDSKSVDPQSGSVVSPGDELIYTLTFENVGEGPGTVSRVDDVTHVLDDATVTAAPEPSDDALVVSDLAGGRYAITGELAPGQVVTVAYTVTVAAAGERGDSVLGNFLLDPDQPPPVEVVCEDGAEDCTVNPVEELVDSKSVDPARGSTVAAGDVLTYTLTFQNLGGTAVQVDRVDDLTHVLDDASVTTAPVSSDATALTVSGLADDRYTIIGDVPAGQTVTVTYTVTVGADGERGDNVLGNFLIDPDEGPPPLPICLLGDEDCTVNDVTEIIDSKSVAPASGTTVVADQQLTYTLTFENVGTGPGTVDRVDDLTHVLDDATVTSGPTSSDDTLEVSELTADRYAITGELAPGQRVTVTYTVTVNAAGALGDHVLANFLLDPSDGPPVEPVCEEGSEDCTVNPVSDVTVVKSADPASGSVVDAGDRVTYTLTFRNAGQGTAQVAWTDHLAGVLDDATVVDQPESSDPALTASGISGRSFTVTGILTAGQVVTVTYALEVKDHDDQGDHALGNFVTVTGEDPPASCEEGSPLCTVHPVDPPVLGGLLPNTGASAWLLLGGAGVLMLLGGTAVVRQRRETEPA